MTPKKIVHVQVRSVYGKEAIYPVCNDSKAFAAIAGTKTLPPHVIKGMVDLGYEVVELQKFSSVIERIESEKWSA